MLMKLYQRHFHRPFHSLKVSRHLVRMRGVILERFPFIEGKD